jgi:serpin B
VWNETASRIDASYEGICRRPGSNGECFEEVEPSLEIANSVWVDDESQLNPEYEDIVQQQLVQIHFADESAGSTINDWVNASTRGLIDSIVDNGPLNGVSLIAINSIYLKATWMKQFRKATTTKDLFFSSPSRPSTTVSDAHFMHQVSNFQYSHTAIPGYQVLQLPFIGALSMLVVLPLTEESYGESTILVSSTDLIEALPQLETTRVAIALPKFKFSSTYQDDLKESLQSIGLISPFIGGLCIFVHDCSLYLNTIIQKTFIDVNEEGVEAAAVTMLMMRLSAPQNIEEPPDPVLFLADHPFQFFIYDSKEEVMLFEGRVGNPGIPQGAPEPELKKSHGSHSDFWQTIFGVNNVNVTQ